MATSRHEDVIASKNTGRPIEGYTVTVKEAGTDTLATLTNRTGGALANPVTTDSTGTFYFYANAGDYDLYHGTTLLREYVPVGKF